MSGKSQHMPLYSRNGYIQQCLHKINYLNKELYQANNAIKYYKTKIILLEEENKKLEEHKQTIHTSHTICNIAKLSKTFNRGDSIIKHPKSFSNLATYLTLEKCSLIHDILTDDEEDE